MMYEALESRAFLPEELDQNVNLELDQKLQRLASTVVTERSERIQLVLGKEAVELSAEAVDILRHAVEAICQGMAVDAIPQRTMSSTQQAADLLGISRPMLIRIPDNSEIRFFRKRRHRQSCLANMSEYQQRQRWIADEALSNIVANAQVFSGYDVDPEEYLRAVKRVRHGGQASDEKA